MMKERITKLIAALKVTVAIGTFVLAGSAATTNVHAMTTQQITAQMDSLKNQLNGKYWNGKKTGTGDILLSVTNKPCKGTGGDQCNSNRYVYGNVNGRQCTGFAHSYAYYLFGSEFTTWEKRSDVSKVEPGDVIHVNGHEAIVWKVSGTEIKVAECWGTSKCKINYGYFNSRYNTMKSIQKKYGSVTVYKHPGSDDEVGKRPTISIKSVTAPKGNLNKGKNFGLRGIISTDCGVITEVKAYIINTATGKVVLTTKYNPNTVNMDIRYTINNDFSFGKMAKGSYAYVVEATAMNGSEIASTQLINTAFTIK